MCPLGEGADFCDTRGRHEVRLRRRGGASWAQPQVAGDAVGADRRPVAVVVAAADKMGQMFFLFNNRLGCLGSLLVSVVGTAVLVLVLVLVNGR